MPIVLAQDGPSLGGFVCACTIVSTELWKMGQVCVGVWWGEGLETPSAGCGVRALNVSQSEPQPLL